MDRGAFRSTSILLCLLALGCPGSAKHPRNDGKSAGSEPIPPLLPDGLRSPDRSPLDSAGESPGPDLLLSTTVGGACPCALPLLCVLQACREPCNQVICNGATNCKADESCVNTENNTPVCVPAVGTGQACDQTTVCAAGNLCLTTSAGSEKGLCYATCAGLDQPCATGKCTALPNSPCFFCYP